MTKWEYKILEVDGQGKNQSGNREKFLHKLNELGKEGWELLSVSGSETKVHFVAYLKRPLKEESFI
jgi:hypothetical protein